MSLYKYKLYMNAFRRVVTVNLEGDNSRDNLKKMAFYGVKAVNYKPEPKNRLNEANDNFTLVAVVKDLIGELTPKELENIFPIKKWYDGDKYEWKDYYYTKEYLKKFDPDKPIGEKEAVSLLWEYQNIDINLFAVKVMGYMADMDHLRGRLSTTEQILLDINKGQEVEREEVDGYGGTKHPTTDKIPSYLKIIK